METTGCPFTPPSPFKVGPFSARKLEFPGALGTSTLKLNFRFAGEDHFARVSWTTTEGMLWWGRSTEDHPASFDQEMPFKIIRRVTSKPVHIIGVLLTYPEIEWGE